MRQTELSDKVLKVLTETQMERCREALFLCPSCKAFVPRGGWHGHMSMPPAGPDCARCWAVRGSKDPVETRQTADHKARVRVSRVLS